jgi:hypothetical protein
MTIGRISFCILSSAFCVLLTSCADNKPTTRPATARERQDAAMNDPFGYSPYTEKPDISGGDLGHFDKDAFNKDVDHVLNP